MNKIFFVSAWIGIFLSFLIIAVIIFWDMYPYTPMVFLDKTFTVNKDKVYQGKSITYTGRYCKYMNLTATVTREFRNELIFVSPTTITNRPMGCHTTVVEVIIPVELIPGKYYMHQTYQYRVNPIRTVEITHDTNSFEVLEATASAK